MRRIGCALLRVLLEARGTYKIIYTMVAGAFQLWVEYNSDTSVSIMIIVVRLFSVATPIIGGPFPAMGSANIVTMHPRATDVDRH